MAAPMIFSVLPDGGHSISFLRFLSWFPVVVFGLPDRRPLFFSFRTYFGVDDSAAVGWSRWDVSFPSGIVYLTSFMIAVVDYGMGNLRSVEKGLARTGASVEVTSDPDRVRSADGVVLPGVGAFGACMQNLTGRGLAEPVKDVVRAGKPFLGICLGLQLLFDESEEFGRVEGLGLLHGRVRGFPRESMDGLKIPHMGWNRLDVRKPAAELEGVEQGSFVYFVHSYYVEPADPSMIAATTDYGIELTAAVAKDNVFACQFHPEKSQAIGLGILENFARRVGAGQARADG